MKIGFRGLGRMGTAMVLRLLAAEHDVTVWNRRSSAIAPVVRNGARAAVSPAAAAIDADIVMLCLLDGAAVEHVVFGPLGNCEHKRAAYPGRSLEHLARCHP